MFKKSYPWLFCRGMYAIQAYSCVLEFNFWLVTIACRN